jgi:hypothetical protein
MCIFGSFLRAVVTAGHSHTDATTWTIPVITLSFSGQTITPTMRGIPDCDVTDAICKCQTYSLGERAGIITPGGDSFLDFFPLFFVFNSSVLSRFSP